MMTSKSDPRGHPGLKLCVHVSVMGYYRFINFHQNRKGSGIFLGDFKWNDPSSVNMNCLGSIIVNSTYFLIYQSKVSYVAMCARIVSSDMQRRVVKIFILHGAARRHYHYALGHLWGGALISVPDENTRLSPSPPPP